MSIKGNIRKYSRAPLTLTVRYVVYILDMIELMKIHETAVSVDVSKGGLGMITGYPLRAGHVLTFEDEIKINGFIAKAAIVRWAEKVKGNKYRVGLKFT